ncbi:uncharacterized protein PADG_00798 [Paracoccidioides brasiliensis Pb18]|uniref:Uncharacterized protein n=1 Tax=Paracoccidioides brasiliensis (strain Pb18) TaxID=502780 RepID=C1FYC2_PARBD|nr:uncharacterized protein PADG_00798 [Paracoccidioides brasiliensis Pb18]EEH44509.2 hypothetical protein PADG_00798 [Paracoccidioides brasiliensis Pb18]
MKKKLKFEVGMKMEMKMYLGMNDNNMEKTECGKCSGDQRDGYGWARRQKFREYIGRAERDGTVFGSSRDIRVIMYEVGVTTYLGIEVLESDAISAHADTI